MLIPKNDITGLVLAGGRGSRMGGVDKGLQRYGDRALAQHALTRLLPQVGQAMINANRNLDVYRSMGVPVWPDEMPDYPGPLAGMLSGLAHCETSYLVTVPCDAPNYPLDLVSRLAHGLSENNARSRDSLHTRRRPIISSTGVFFDARIVTKEPSRLHR